MFKTIHPNIVFVFAFKILKNKQKQEREKIPKEPLMVHAQNDLLNLEAPFGYNGG